jgi:hypothetical protein
VVVLDADGRVDGGGARVGDRQRRRRDVADLEVGVAREDLVGQPRVPADVEAVRPGDGRTGGQVDDGDLADKSGSHGELPYRDRGAFRQAHENARAQPSTDPARVLHRFA